MHLDDLLVRHPEERAVERQVAEEITLAVFHGDDEIRRIYAFERLRERAAVPDEITDAVRADGPGAEDQISPAFLKLGQQQVEQAVGLLRGGKVEPRADGVAHVVAVAFADAKD